MVQSTSAVVGVVTYEIWLGCGRKYVLGSMDKSEPTQVVAQIPNASLNRLGYRSTVSQILNGVQTLKDVISRSRW
jgi:hypothetical protein